MAGVKRKRVDWDVLPLHKEWDEVLCPICMDHPHNAVLALCSSHDKGCRAYICDTSYRHSNCLDRFKKQSDSSRNETPARSSIAADPFNSSNRADTNLSLTTNDEHLNEINHLDEINSITFVGTTEGYTEYTFQNSRVQQQMQNEGTTEAIERAGPEEGNNNGNESESSLKCPLCRGDIIGWEIVEEARKYFNMKKRNCAMESCTFLGNYKELRSHARRAHPATRPSDTDPSREQAWRSLELQREFGDIVSAIRSATPGAFVVGDYVIENGDGPLFERESRADEDVSPWWNPFFLFQMMGSIDGAAEPRSRSRPWMRHHRAAGGVPRRRFLWGENLLGLQDDDDDSEDEDNDAEVHRSSNAGEESELIPRTRRRLTRSRSDDRS